MNGRSVFTTLLFLGLGALAAAAQAPEVIRMEGVRALYTRPANAQEPQADPRLAAGKKRIRAGKASTVFPTSANGVKAAVAGISFTDPDEPKTAAAQERSIKTSLQQFNDRMKRAGLRPNDFADGCAMAHAIYYQCFTGRRLDAKALKTNRDRARKLLLADERFQGTGDGGREVIYIRLAAVAMYSINCREQAAESENGGMREALIARARRNATQSGFLSGAR